MATIDETEIFDLPLKDARRLLPGRPSLQTVLRWTMLGVRGCVLESQPSGHRIYTSKPAIERFLSALAETRRCEVQQPVHARVRELNRRNRDAIENVRRMLVSGAGCERAKKMRPALVTGRAVQEEFGAPPEP